MKSYYSFGFGAVAASDAWSCLVQCAQKSGKTSATLAKETGIPEALLGKMVNAYAVGGVVAAAQEFAIAHGLSVADVQTRPEFITLTNSFGTILAACGCIASTAPPSQVPAPVPTTAATPTGMVLDAATLAALRAQAAKVSTATSAFQQLKAIATPETQAIAAQQAAARQAAAAAASGETTMTKILPIAAAALLALAVLK